MISDIEFVEFISQLRVWLLYSIFETCYDVISLSTRMGLVLVFELLYCICSYDFWASLSFKIYWSILNWTNCFWSRFGNLPSRQPRRRTRWRRCMTARFDCSFVSSWQPPDDHHVPRDSYHSNNFRIQRIYYQNDLKNNGLISMVGRCSLSVGHSWERCEYLNEIIGTCEQGDT